MRQGFHEDTPQEQLHPDTEYMNCELLLDQLRGSTFSVRAAALVRRKASAVDAFRIGRSRHLRVQVQLLDIKLPTTLQGDLKVPLASPTYKQYSTSVSMSQLPNLISCYSTECFHYWCGSSVAPFLWATPPPLRAVITPKGAQISRYRLVRYPVYID
jgi:hypothetical protein